LHAGPAALGQRHDVVVLVAALMPTSGTSVEASGEPARDLMIASTQAVNNAVQHGRAWPNGRVLFVTELCPRGRRVEVCDLADIRQRTPARAT
jgi:hypothetical protein